MASGSGTKLRLGWYLAWGFLVVGALRLVAQPPPESPPVSVQSGCEVDYPPFCFVHQDGRPDGFSVELMRAALSAMGREAVFRTGVWTDVGGWLEHGEVDALPLVGRTPEREEAFDFTVPYLTMHGAIVVRSDDYDTREIGDLRGRRVAVMKGDNAEEFLRREERGLTVLPLPTFAAAFRALAAGDCDAVVVQRLVALRLLAESGLTNLRIVDRPVTGLRQDLCFAVKEGDRETLALLNEGLALVVADGTRRRLHAKWFARLELPPDRSLVVGGDYNYPPFEFLDKAGHPTGFAVDLTRAIAREMNLNVQIRLGPWEDTLDGLRNGEIDAVQGAFYSPGRSRTMAFSPMYLVSHFVGVVRSGERKPPETLEELAGRDVVAQAGDAIVDELARRRIEAHLTTVGSQEETLRAVAEGKHECALVVRFGALWLIEEKGWDNLVIGTSNLHTGEYSYAVPIGGEALLSELTEGLRVVRQTGEFRRIHDKWLGSYEPTGVPRRTVLKYIAAAVVPLLLVAGVALLWSWWLRRLVAQRTEELRQSSEFQRAIVNCSPVALYSIDRNSIVLSWNASAERMFGWKAEEAVGKSLPLVPDEGQKDYQDVRRQALLGTESVGKEQLRRRKDGTVFPVNLSMAPIRDAEGEVVGIMSAAEDITQRRQAQEALADSERRYRTYIGAAPNAIFVADEQGQFLEVNAAACTMTGYEADELVRMRVVDLIREGERAAAMEQLRRVIETGKASCICPFRHKDGSIRWWNAEAVGLSAGRFLGIATDLTAVRRAEEELRASEERFRSLVEGSPDAIFIQAEGRFAYANPATLRLFGATDAAQLLGQPVADRFPPSGRDRLRQRTHMLVVDKRAVPLIEDTYLRIDGSGVPVEVAAVPTVHDGKDGGIVFVRDISARKKHENELHRIEWMLTPAHLPRPNQPLAAPTSLAVPDGGGTILRAVGRDPLRDIVSDFLDLLDTSAAVHERVGSHACGIFASDWCRLLGEAAAPVGSSQPCHGLCWSEAANAAMETGAPADLPCAGDLSLHAVPIRAGGEIVGAASFSYGDPPRDPEALRDIAARHHVDAEKLARAAESYESRPPYVVDMAKRRIEAAARLIGQMVERDRAEEGVRHLNRVLRAVRDVNQLIVRESEPARLIRTACSLLVEDRSYGGALIVLTDEQGHPTASAQAGMDAAYPALAAWMRENGLPPCCAKAIAAEDVFTVAEPRSVCHPCPIAADCSGNGVMCARMAHDHETFGLLAVGGNVRMAIDDEERELFQEVAGDLGYALHTMAVHSAREQAERARDTARQQLQQVQKMESIGRLAGGVAHDFNNMITGILGYAELCREDVPNNHPVQEWLGEITREAHRSSDLTRQLLAFARQQTISPEVIDLNDAVAGMTKLLRRLIGEDIDLAWQPCLDLWPVNMDPGQIDQILINLCVNARDAIGGVGKVTIRTAKASVGETYCADHPEATPGAYAVLEVDDNGCGMDAATLEHAFEPFFTTKPLGGGTGLGLSTVYGIVRQNGGFVDVCSEPGRGTTFRVHLPRFEGEADNGNQSAEQRQLPRGSETVLLVEDERSVRAIASHFLTHQGYTVLAAATPEDAMRQAAARDGAIHLLVTDVVMPGMSGRDLAAELAGMRPEMRCLFISGYTADVIADRGVLDANVEFLPKPFTREEIAHKVRDVLDALPEGTA